MILSYTSRRETTPRPPRNPNGWQRKQTTRATNAFTLAKRTSRCPVCSLMIAEQHDYIAMVFPTNVWVHAGKCFDLAQLEQHNQRS